MARKQRRFVQVTPIIRGVGMLLHIPALMALVSLPVCAFFGEYSGFTTLGLTAAVSLVGGQILYWPARRGVATQSRHAMLIAAITWLAVPGVAALPFMLGVGTPPLDAVFESISGFTGAGMTMLKPAGLPHYLQWWRSLTQWLGEVGVILLLLSILPPRRDALELYYSESRDQKLLPSVRSTTRAIWSIYGLYTLLGIGLLWLGGVPIWRAVNHGLTAIATGGFTLTNDSLMQAPPLAKALYIPIMIAGAISFYVHYQAIHERRPHVWITGSENRLFWGVLILGAGILVADNLGLEQSDWLDSILQWVSALTTTGVQSASLENWHPGTLFFLSLAMLVGGAAGSTSGGLKQLRIVLLYKSIVWRLAEITRRPHEIIRLTFDGEALSKADARSRVQSVTTLIYAWAVVLTVAILVMTYCVPPDTPLQYTIFDVVSAQSDVGLSTGMINADLSMGGKLTLMAVMWMGRLEIIPVMVLVAVVLRRAAQRRRYRRPF
jgi:trk system potassium uptake protein TrkH